MSTAHLSTPEPPLRRAVLWLLVCAAMFFGGYSATNALASHRGIATVLTMPGDNVMPFWAWSIIPYVSINFLYVFAFLLQRTRRELDRHALRILTAQAISMLFFVLLPTMNVRAQPPVSGALGLFFDGLRSFDRPFNMLPSLHVAIAVIVWDALRRQIPSLWQPVWHIWCVLIVVSTLTTWQHYLLDVATGLLLGILCLRFWPLTTPQPGAAVMR